MGRRASEPPASGTRSPLRGGLLSNAPAPGRRPTKLNLGFLVINVTGKLGGLRARRDKLSGAITLAPLIPHQTLDVPHEQDRCPCESWATADAAWVAMTENERQAWRDGVTVPGMSGYDYWMSWSVWCWTRGLSAPGTPPPSGGYSHNEQYCLGGADPPPVCDKAPPPPVGEDCPNCPALTPGYVDAVAAGFPAPVSSWNGTHKATQDLVDFCHWHKFWGDNHVNPRVEINAQQHLRIFYEGTYDGELHTCTYDSTDEADCYEDNVLPFLEHANVPDHPDTVLWCPGQAP